MSKNICFQVPINHPIVLGKLGSAHGIYGWLRVFSYTECSKDIFEYQPWFIKNLNKWQHLELEEWKPYKQNFIIKIKYFDNRNAANLMTNCKIIVDSNQLPILKDNKYYWKDLIGCKVITTQGYSLGYVQYLIETGSNDVLVIKANLKDAFGIKERLIPFLYEKVIKKIDLTKKIIEVYWDSNF